MRLPLDVTHRSNALLIPGKTYTVTISISTVPPVSETVTVTVKVTLTETQTEQVTVVRPADDGVTLGVRGQCKAF
jgi:hypothetical protein